MGNGAPVSIFQHSLTRREIVLIIVVAVVFGLVGAAIWSFAMVGWDATAAAWAQAVLTGAAVIASGFIASHQVKAAATEAQRNRDLERHAIRCRQAVVVRAAYLVAVDINFVAIKAEEFFVGSRTLKGPNLRLGAGNVLAEGGLNAALDDLKDLSVTDMPDDDAAIALVSLRQVCRALLRDLNKIALGENRRQSVISLSKRSLWAMKTLQSKLEPHLSV